MYKKFIIFFIMSVFVFCGAPLKASAMYTTDVVDYVSWTQEKVVLIGSWDDMADKEEHYKTISFPHSYKISGTHYAYSDSKLVGVYYKRTVYKYYDYTIS